MAFILRLANQKPYKLSFVCTTVNPISIDVWCVRLPYHVMYIINVLFIRAEWLIDWLIYWLCRPNVQVESCEPWTDSPSQQVDFAFNMFFLVYFVIRVSWSRIKYVLSVISTRHNMTSKRRITLPSSLINSIHSRLYTCDTDPLATQPPRCTTTILLG